MRIRVHAITDKGLHRSENEDSFAYSLNAQDWLCVKDCCMTIPDVGSIFIVADGMGGEIAGSVASSLAVESIKKSFVSAELHEKIVSEKEILAFLEWTVVEANRVIMDTAREKAGLYGMATTIVVCWILNTKAYVAWCGDSRCYLFDPKQGLKCMTKDHSLVQELIDNNVISEVEALTHPDSGVITRCLGGDGTMAEPDVVIYELQPQDNLLLCSDGLCGYCSNKSIEKVLYRHCSDIVKIGASLVKLAIDFGGYDNVTVLNIKLLDDEDRKSGASFKERVRNWMGFCG